MSSLVPFALAAVAGGFVLCTIGPRERTCYTEQQIRREAEYREYRAYRAQGYQMMYLDETERADATTRRLIRERGDTICSEHPVPPSPGNSTQRRSSRRPPT